jgi:hypothetical protein
MEFVVAFFVLIFLGLYLDNRMKKKIYNNRVAEKYGERSIDFSLSLFQRNLDVIEVFENKIKDDGYRPYYIENLTRDCINEICFVEQKDLYKPGTVYLRDWKRKVNSEWRELATYVENKFKKKLAKISEDKSLIRASKYKFKEKLQEIYDPTDLLKIHKYIQTKDLFIEDIDKILENGNSNWKSIEENHINNEYSFDMFPIDNIPQQYSDSKKLIKDIKKYNENVLNHNKKFLEISQYFNDLLKGFNENNKEDVLERVDFILNNIKFPKSCPKEWNTDYDQDQRILIIESMLPDVVYSQVFKNVSLVSGNKTKTISKAERKEIVPKFHPAIMLKTAHEILHSDYSKTIKLLVVNGIVEYIDPADGNSKKTYTASLAVNHDNILKLNLDKLDPVIAFDNLNGKSAGSLIDVVPIVPTMKLNKKDDRFVMTKEVLNNTSSESNLASMDWQDFENLIAELFHKEFEEKGAEVKVTQSSRDRGVDAIVFDPDPIKGGKFVIQAKRYTRTVDVSAVRDLCAVVKKEGASRGILVTTSKYGADAYKFAQNEPVTLLNGSELLGLLEKHGYSFRINISEARKILNESKTKIEK